MHVRMLISMLIYLTFFFNGFPEYKQTKFHKFHKRFPYYANLSSINK